MSIKPLIYTFALALLSQACNSSNDDSKTETNTDGKLTSLISFESFSFDRIAQFRDFSFDNSKTDGEAYVLISARGVLPASTGREGNEALRDSLLSSINMQRDENHRIIPKLDDDLKLTDLVADKTKTGSSIIARLSISLLTPKVVVWAAYNSLYFYGAAHGLDGTKYLNYSLSDNKIFTYDDLFIPGYEKELTNMIRSYLKEKHSDDLDVSLSDVDIPNNFCITDNGINFYYAAYEIAPYAAGEIIVKIYTYQLEDILSEKGKDLFVNMDR